MSDSTKNQIEALNQELTPIKEERNQLNLEAKKLADKRNILHEKVRNLQKEASTIKEKRDAINKQVQELKTLRNQMNSKGKEKRNKINELHDKISVLNEKRPNGNLRQVAEQIKEIDWEIQTNSLPIKEEQELVNQVRELETQLVFQKRIEKVKDKLYELRTEQKDFGTEAQTIHGKLSELVEQSQKLHTQMVGVLDRARELQAEADEAHQKCVEIRKQAHQKHEKYVELIKQIRVVKQELKDTADKNQAKRKDELKIELEEKALLKLKNGEKLLWEEFQILAEKGLL